MRNVDRLPFIFAGVLFLLAWLLGFPMRAQSAPLGDVRVHADRRCGERQDALPGRDLRPAFGAHGSMCHRCCWSFPSVTWKAGGDIATLEIFDFVEA